MKKEDALRAILTEWRRLPETERQTESQLFAFAMRMANDSNYNFQSRSDRYQDIMGYMTRHTSGLRKMGI
ncbi:MAG: hypothetical protein ACRD7E_33010 [Bryobacteraceae bacterium]